METKFTARNERVYNGEKMIASIWAEYPSKDCLPGESWMQMMDRTEGAREKATQDTFDRARLFAAAPELLEVAYQSLALIGAIPHGDNCFVSSHYEGDPGDRCNCGKDSAIAALDAAIDKATGSNA